MNDFKNPLLQQAAQAVMAKVPAQLQPIVQKIVATGEKVMYSPNTRDMMFKQLGGDGEPAELAGAGAAKLFGILFNQSKKTIPLEAGAPAAAILLFEGLDFLEQAGKVQVTPDVLAQATQALGSNMLQLLGVGPDKIQMLMTKANSAQAAAQGNAEQPQGGAMQATTAPPGGIVASAQGA